MAELLLTSLTKGELQDLVAECVASELQKSHAQNPQTHLPIKQFLTVEEVISEFQISRTTLYMWRKKKILPYSRVGRLLFIARNDLISVIESTKNGGVRI